ncbi:hypothetical protein ES703_79252 [subsurface metagenome]
MPSDCYFKVISLLLLAGKTALLFLDHVEWEHPMYFHQN